jgi:S-formylglutathione hydrolase FrmB
MGMGSNTSTVTGPRRPGLRGHHLIAGLLVSGGVVFGVSWQLGTASVHITGPRSAVSAAGMAAVNGPSNTSAPLIESRTAPAPATESTPPVAPTATGGSTPPPTAGAPADIHTFVPVTTAVPTVATVKVTGPGTVSEISVTDGLGIAHSVSVYRPSTDATVPLPVVYFLVGYPARAADGAASLAPILDAAFESGTSPFVMVLPESTSATHDDSEWADSVDGTQAIESFITGPLIRAVEGAPVPASMRAIAGFSMGGYGAMNLAEHHPDLYGQVVSLAGYFKIDDPDGVFGIDALAQVTNSPDRHVDALAGTRIMLREGASDTGQPEAGELVRFAAILQAAGLDADVAETPGGHSWSWLSGQMGDVITFVNTGFGTLTPTA